MILRESQLDAWVRAHPRDAEGLIPELIGRLVAQGAPAATLRRFPGRDAIGQPGIDGRLCTLKVEEPMSAWIPLGDSHWEIGTGADPRSKATDDYTRRTTTTPEEERLQSTFVFVTPLSARRVFPFTGRTGGQLQWIQERVGEQKWKDVRVIDGTGLCEWLRASPAISRWLVADIGGLASVGVEGLDERWDALSSIAVPHLTPNVFLAGRDGARERLSKVFSGETNFLRVRVQASADLADFVSAHAASLPPAEREAAIGSSLIVSTTEAWTFLVEQSEPQILIVSDGLDLSDAAGGLAIQKARLKGHRVLLPRLDHVHDDDTLALPSPGRSRLEKALQEAGLAGDRARTMASRCAGNLTTLKRMLSGGVDAPKWSKSAFVPELVLALQLGAWSEDHPADIQLIEELSGRKYELWVLALHEVLRLPETPLQYRAKSWQFKARFEGWYALGPNLLDQAIERAGAAASRVLSEHDPQFDLPKEERYMAQVLGKDLKYSRQLRAGLAELLALFGSHPGALVSCSRPKVEGVAWKAVRELLQDPDYLRWASLDPELPLLAEGSPDAFLSAIESALAKEPSPLAAVFKEESDGVFGRTHMCGLLWGLESLAWDAAQFGRVVLILGAMAEIDPGGSWGNRPDSTLVTILLPWLPQTTATEAQRVRAVRSLLEEQPRVAWKVLLSLLPEERGFSMPIHRPRWKDLDLPSWTDGATSEEVFSQVGSYSELAVDAAGKSTTRVVELIRKFPHLHAGARREVTDRLRADRMQHAGETDRFEIWRALCDLVRKHRRFADADWSLPADEVHTLAGVADELAPVSPILRAVPSFRQRWHEVIEEQGTWAEQEKRLLLRRQDALRSVLDAHGFAGILDLARQVEDVDRVGFVLGESPELASANEGLILPALIDSSEECLAKLAGAYCRARYWKGSLAWAGSIVTNAWSNSQVAAFFLALPAEPAVWQLAEGRLGDKRDLYWGRVVVTPRGPESGASEALGRLLEAQRPKAALVAIYFMISDKEPVAPGTAIDALLAAIHSQESGPPLDGYQVGEIIGALQENPETPAADLVKVEWAYLPALDRHGRGRPKTLEQGLASEPRFFSEVVSLVYKPRNAERVDLDADATARAHNAWKLLHEWRTPPGVRPDGSVDGDALKNWLADAKEICTRSDRLEVAMQCIGQVLIHFPADPDGLWIHRSAAAVLNEPKADHLREGFRIATLNSRGAFWRDHEGAPERELANKYRTRAAEVEAAGFPRFATTLRDIAATYEREVERARNDGPRDE